VSIGLVVSLLAAGATAPAPPRAAQAGPVDGAAATPSIALPASPLTETQRIVHVLNRLGYGPRPGDVERVRRLGLARYIAQQLHPARIPDPAADRLPEVYPTLAMSTRDLVRAYPTSARGRGLGTREMKPGAADDPQPYTPLSEMAAAKVARAVV